jgi:hypothetical protein
MYYFFNIKSDFAALLVKLVKRIDRSKQSRMWHILGTWYIYKAIVVGFERRKYVTYEMKRILFYIRWVYSDKNRDTLSSPKTLLPLWLNCCHHWCFMLRLTICLIKILISIYKIIEHISNFFSDKWNHNRNIW